MTLATELQASGRMKTHAGEYPIRKARVDGVIALGSFTLDSTTVLFSDVRPGSSEPVGNIGYEGLRTFAVTLDAKNRRIQLSR